MHRVLVSLQCHYRCTDSHESPVIFVHGFPDSSKIFAKYFCEEERKHSWLINRTIFSISFMNRHSTANKTFNNESNNTNQVPSSVSKDEMILKNITEMPPTLFELFSGLPERHFGASLLDVINESPTGKIIIIAHDWGATYVWNFLKDYEEISNECLEYFVSLSVGSSFRYDIWEHGIRALLWYYDVLFSLPYFFPKVKFFERMLHTLLEKFAGYKHKTAPNEYDCWHYWYAPFKLIKLPFLLFGFGAEEEYVNMSFPVLFIRSTVDSIASTKVFEDEIKRRPDCVFIEKDFKGGHFFPESDSDFVLQQIRLFHKRLEHLGYFDLINISTQTFFDLLPQQED